MKQSLNQSYQQFKIKQVDLQYKQSSICHVKQSQVHWTGTITTLEEICKIIMLTIVHKFKIIKIQ